MAYEKDVLQGFRITYRHMQQNVYKVLNFDVPFVRD